MNTDDDRFRTQAIHGGRPERTADAPLVEPIYQNSSFCFKTLQDAEDVFTFRRKGFVYTRGGNPTVNLLEKRVSLLEKGADAVCFASGMGAIATVLLSLLKTGDTIVASAASYGSTHSLIKDFFSRYGVKARFVDLTRPELIREHDDGSVKVVYFETPMNPTLELVDIRAVAGIAHAIGARVVCDNTLASPYFQQPLEHGADVVVHSMTKYINGHGDALGGIAVSRDADYIASLKFSFMCELGIPLDPNSAYLMLRGLKTLAIRMEEHARNARALAEYLDGHRHVTCVAFPGLAGFPFKDLAARQMSGPGAIVSFQLEGGFEKARAFVESCRLPSLAVSLGSCETLIEHPLSMTHRSYLAQPASPVCRCLENLIRVSVGLEDRRDLIGDFERTFKSVYGD